MLKEESSVNSRLKFSAFFSLCLLSAALIPICKIVIFNADDIGEEFVDTVLFSLLFGVFTFFISFITYSHLTKGPLWVLCCTLLYASFLNSFFIPNSLTVSDGTDPLGFVLREEARYVLLVIFVILVAVFVLGSSRNQKFEKIRIAVFSIAEVVIAISVALTIYTFVSLPQKKSALLEHFGKLEESPRITLGPKNVLVLSFDQVQGSAFKGYLESNEGRERAKILDGFRFYPNAVSTYPNTTYSLASTILGRAVEVDTETYNEVVEHQDGIIRAAEEKGFDTDFKYGAGNYFTTQSYADRKDAPTLLPLNAVNLAFGVNIAPLLPISGDPELAQYKWKGNPDAYRSQLAESLRLDRDSSNTLNFFHFLFSHQPFSVDQNCSKYSSSDLERGQNVGGFADTAGCLVRILDGVITSLKAIDAYDNTAIFVIADHGFEVNINNLARDPQYQNYFFKHSEYLSNGNIKALGSYNPLLMFKDIGEHGSFSLSDESVSLIDIAPTICRLIACDRNNWQGQDLGQPYNENRKHSFWIYSGGSSDRFKDGFDRLHSFKPEYWTKIVAPAPFSFSKLEDFLRLRDIETVPCNEKLSFSEKSVERYVIAKGLSVHETFGRWSDGSTVELWFAPKGGCHPDALELDFHAFVTPEHPEQTGAIFVNDNPVGQIRFGLQDGSSKKLLVKLPESTSGPYLVRFEIDKPRSPQSLGLSKDSRSLGFGFHSIKVISTSGGVKRAL